MECILEANPGPEIRWFRGDTSIEETTPRYKMTRKKTARDQYTLTLTISAPTQEDGGQYRCNAVNAYGESNANIALNFAGKSKRSCPHVSFIILYHVTFNFWLVSLRHDTSFKRAGSGTQNVIKL